MPPVGPFAIGVEDEDPVSARVLEEGALRDDHALGRLPQLEVDIIGLSAADVVGALAGKDEVRAKLPVAHLGIDLAYREAEIGPLPLERRGEARPHPVDVMLVDHRLDLVVGEVVDLADHLARRDVLPQHDIEQSQLAVDL